MYIEAESTARGQNILSLTKKNKENITAFK